MAQNYNRPKEGFRFKFGGMNTHMPPDALSPDKYPIAQNIRSYVDQSVRTRPGQALRFNTGGNPITSMRTYGAIFTDDLPRILAVDTLGRVYLDTSTQVGTVGSGSQGVTMLPFRPSQSPNPYMYVASAKAYNKYSAPNASNTVTENLVGIAEPQSPPDATINSLIGVQYNPVASNYTHGGTAGGASNGVRVSDTTGVVFQDLVDTSSIFSVQVSSTEQYQRYMDLFINSYPFIVQDVFPALTQSFAIESIYYFETGANTGHCIIVPANLGGDAESGEESISTPQLLVSLRRGAIIQVGAELCYVWSTSIGPNGTISIETSTANTHTTADMLTSVSAIQVEAYTGFSPIAGQAISSADVSYAIGSEFGTQTFTLSASPFVIDNPSFGEVGTALQVDDYISIGLNVDNLSNLVEVKFLIDVGDGSFTENFYYYTIRASDIAEAVANNVTQLSAAQTVTQRSIVDEENSIQSGGQGVTYAGSQTVPGSGQWSQIFFPIREMTRVGGDTTKSLQTANAIQFLWNVLPNTLNVKTSGVIFLGGSQPDVGDVGIPYLYRIRGRSSITGIVSNPSPATRYGVNPRREQVIVVTNIPFAYDPQVDTIEVFRYGGTVTSWRYIGQVAVGTPTFLDNYDDASAQGGDELDFDNFQPWPSIDLPLNATANVTGTAAVVTIPTASLATVGNYLPGNLVRIGDQNVYTLWTRPTLIGANNYLFQFEENAGFGTNLPVVIYEPILANQFLPYMFGPDANGVVFACGDPLRPGTLYYSKPNNPDSAPDTNNTELCPPSEPLLGGDTLDGLAFVASPERWWALYPQSSNEEQPYAAVEQPVSRGLAAPFGKHCDGQDIYFWAKDGIWAVKRGSLTDADLFNLFPRDGVIGKVVTYNGVTIQPPDYTRAATFRMEAFNGYIYATYQDSTGDYHTLTCDLRGQLPMWSVDAYTPAATGFCHPDQQASTLLTTAARYDELYISNVAGQVSSQTDGVNDLGGPIACIVATFEFGAGDIRTDDQYGDIYLDSQPAASGAPLILAPLSLGAPTAPPQTIPVAAVRGNLPVSLGGEILSHFLGVMFTWTDDYTKQTVPTILYAWQPSVIPKPETIADRYTDWDDAGVAGAKWFQGFILHADTYDAIKGLAIRDTDSLTTHPFSPAVQQNGESEVAYSFNTPFIAHMVRIEPTDQVYWRFFEVRWVAEPTPEFAETWQTQGTSFGLTGYMHVKQISAAYASTVPITLTITSFDGQSPQPITLPSTGGAYQKITFQLDANKGQLYFFKTSANAPYQLYLEDWEVMVGGWGRTGPYMRYTNIGGNRGDQARV